MNVLYMEKELNGNSSSIAIVAERGTRESRGELGHRRGGSWRDENGDEEEAMTEMGRETKRETRG
jgi:hypothetical protein